MDPIAWDIRYGLPNQQYMDYVDLSLLGGHNKRCDPFVPYVSTNGIYVSRTPVEFELTQSGNRIVLGNRGSGKTTSAQWLYREISYSRPLVYRTLAIDFPLFEVDLQAFGSDETDYNLREQILSHLITLIFETYWNHMVVLRQPTLLTWLRKDREWMSKLHWFYNHYPPRCYQLFYDFELWTWLHSSFPHSPFSSRIEGQDILTELIQFITTVPFDPNKYFGEEFHWPYQKIRLIIDCAGDIPFHKRASLAQFIQKLCDLSLPKLEFTLFVNSDADKLIMKLPCVQSGHVSLYRLPPWNFQEIQSILDKRIVAFGGEFSDYAGNITNWGSSLPGLNPAVRYHFRQILIEGALLAYNKPTEFDAPIHALKLARGLLAACAGCWPERFPPPLNARQLQEIIALYWEGEKGGEM